MVRFRFLTFIATLVLFLICKASLHAQTITVGSFADQQMQIERLLSDSTTVSPVLRPYQLQQYRAVMDSETTHRGWWNQKQFISEMSIPGAFSIGLVPISIQNTLNSRFAYGENNGAAWYGRGNNVEFTGGFFLRNDFFSLSLQPHLIYQENLFIPTPRYFFDVSNPFVSEIGGNIDAPHRFGDSSFTTMDWGNSSLRFHYGRFETGVSSEPLWWSSVQKYPLIMSNNAPGIPHFFVGTTERVRIPYFGSIHFKWMVGYPQESGFFAGEGAGITRFFNSGTFSYNPPFLQQLTLGVNRAYHVYEENGFELSNLFLLFDPIRRSRLVSQQGEDGVRQARNQIASIYMHLLLPRANAEIFAEFFREDHSYDFRDLFMQPHHNAAYAFGLRKLSFTPIFDFVETHLELTSLTASQLNQVRPQAFFYSHDPIIQGHTHRGHILGAAIGPGSNSQYLRITGHKGNYSAGFFLQRVVNNDNLHFREGSVKLSPFREFGDYFRHNVFFHSGIHFLRKMDKLVLQGRLVRSKEFNYNRLETALYDGSTLQNHNQIDRINLQLQFRLTYLF